MTKTDFQLAGSFDDSWPPFAAAGAAETTRGAVRAVVAPFTDDSWPPSGSHANSTHPATMSHGSSSPHATRLRPPV
jgi:hypothetical protein